MTFFESKWKAAVVFGGTLVAIAVLAGTLLHERAPRDAGIDIEGVTVLPAPLRMPDFDLIDAHGEPFNRKRLRGHWTLVAFGYTHCPDICPLTLADMARLFERLDAHAARSSQFVFVSVDPFRDQPAELDAYVSYFRPDFVAVTGAPGELQRLGEELGLPYEYGDPVARRPIPGVTQRPAIDGYVVSHYAGLLLIDPGARLVATILPPLDPGRVLPAYTEIRNRMGDPL